MTASVSPDAGPVVLPVREAGETVSGPIHGVGIDVVAVDDVDRSLSRFGQRYLDRLLSSDEATALAPRGVRTAGLPLALARAFALKEAVTKALGPGAVTAWSWSWVEVPPGPVRRRAVVTLHREAARCAFASGVTELHLDVDSRGAGHLVVATTIAVTRGTA